MLPDIAAGTWVTIPQAGLVITAYALGVVVGAPLLAAFVFKDARSWPASAHTTTTQTSRYGTALVPRPADVGM